MTPINMENYGRDEISPNLPREECVPYCIVRHRGDIQNAPKYQNLEAILLITLSNSSLTY
jgi:hypothetical protein